MKYQIAVKKGVLIWSMKRNDEKWKVVISVIVMFWDEKFWFFLIYIFLNKKWEYAKKKSSQIDYFNELFVFN